MVLEIVANISLLTRKDVKTTRRLTSDANERTYGVWRSVNREFNIAQAIGIKEERCNYVNSMFGGSLKTCFSRNEFRGYLKQIGEYVESAKKKAENNMKGSWIITLRNLL